MCKWSCHLCWPCHWLTISYCHNRNPLQPQILQVWSQHSPSEVCIQELEGRSPSGKMGPHRLQTLRWMFDMCTKKEPWRRLEHLSWYWRECSSGLRPKTKCSSHQSFPSMSSSCQPQSAPNVVVIGGISLSQVHREIWECRYCAACHCHPRWWTWMSPFSWLVAHQLSHSLSPCWREQDRPTGGASWRSSTIYSNWKRVRVETDLVAPRISLGALKCSEPSKMRVTEVSKGRFNMTPSLEWGYCQGKKVSPQLFSHCWLVMPVPRFHFYLSASLKNGPPVPSRMPRSPP